MEKKAFAKINLTLDITGRLENGYHSLFTVMTSVKCADIITVEKRSDDKIVLTADKAYIPLDGSNTCYKAAELFRLLTGIKNGCNIDIQNRVPSGAGLGNSSADAAAVLQMLNEIYSFPVDNNVLCEESLRVGADVPFCFAGGTRLCLNEGGELHRLPDFDYPVIIVKPSVSFPTAGAYARYDALADVIHPENAMFLEYAEKGEYKTALSFAGNVFEQVQPEQPTKDIKNRLLDSGAFFASMSGSGSAVFGVFEKDIPPEKLESIAEYFRTEENFAELSL